MRIKKIVFFLLLFFSLSIYSIEDKQEGHSHIINRKLEESAKKADKEKVRKYMFIGTGVGIIFLTIRRYLKNRLK